MIYESELQKLEEQLLERDRRPSTETARPCAISMAETGETGFNTGRARYRVFCETCKRLVHEATTGPEQMINAHLRDVAESAQPLQEADAKLLAHMPILIVELRRYAQALAERHIERQRFDQDREIAQAERLLELVQLVEKLP